MGSIRRARRRIDLPGAGAIRSAIAYRIGGYVIAAATFAAGVGLIAGASAMRVSAIYASAGPQLFPYLIGGAMVVIGLVAFREAYLGRLAPEGVMELDLGPMALAAAGLLVQIVTIEPLGWIPSATALFMVGARAFGSRNLLLDLLIGLALSGTAFLLFDRWLGLRLPPGDWLFG